MRGKKIMGMAAATLLLLSLTACGANNSQQSKNGFSASSKTTKTTDSIVGTYQNKNNGKGSAVKLNADGTGRYVYADPVNEDTNDQLTWKKNGDNEYTLNFQDFDVTSPVTAHLAGNQLTLTGDSNWQTDTLTRANSSLNLDQFLSQRHGNGSTSNGSAASTDPRQVGAMLYQYTYQGMPGRKRFNFSDDGGSYSFGEANDSSGTITYRIKGDTVTYSAGGSGDQRTVKIGELKVQTDPEQIAGIVSHTD